MSDIERALFEMTEESAKAVFYKIRITIGLDKKENETYKEALTRGVLNQ